MPADEKVQRVMTRIGVWKPEEKCLLAQPVGAPSRGYYCLNHGTYALHDIPCPDPSDPAIIVAMLEWLLLNWIPSAPIVIVPRSHRNEEEGDYESEWHGGALPDALIDAIDALPEN